MPSIGLRRLTAGERSPKKVRRRSETSFQLPPASVLSSWLLPVTAHIPERPVDDSLFSVLPAEIIETVFVTLIRLPRDAGDEILDDSQHDRRFRLKPNLTVSAVCRRWRSIALRCPMVWHKITPNDADSRFVWTQLCISRTGSTSPLDIMFDWPTRSVTCTDPPATNIPLSEGGHREAAITVMRLLLPHAARWRSFSAQITDSDALSSVLQSIAHLATAPRLLHLSIVHLAPADNEASRWYDVPPLWQVELPPAPSFDRFLRSATKLRSLALWNSADCINWPHVAPNSSRLSQLSVASPHSPRVQRLMIESCASKLTELVLRLGRSNSQHIANLSLPAVDLPNLHRLVLVGPGVDSHLPSGEARTPRILAGLLRVSTVNVLEFHGCDQETIESFVGLSPSGGGQQDAGIKRADEIFAAVRRLVLLNVIPPSRAPSGVIQPLHRLAAAFRALPAVTDLTLCFRVETMPLSVQGADSKAHLVCGVDVSNVFLGLASVGDGSESGMLRGEALPLPNLARLECEGITMENMARTLKIRKKRGGRPLSFLRVHLPPTIPQSTSPSRTQSQQSITATSLHEPDSQLLGNQQTYEDKLAHHVRLLSVVRPVKGSYSGEGRSHAPWFL